MKRVRTIILPIAFVLTFLFGFILRGSFTPPSDSAKTLSDSGKYRVTVVLDGDTIEVTNGTRVRYAGIDAPELHERFGTAAYEFNKNLVSGKTVDIVVSEEKTDLYGRMLGYVYLPDGTFVNRKLIEEGYATVLSYTKMKKPTYYDQFLILQEEARRDHRGMWVSEWK